MISESIEQTLCASMNLQECSCHKYLSCSDHAYGCRYTADSIILGEIPNSHPYLTGLGIFGGLATFNNPLQGVILGPMALTVLSVLYNLRYSSNAKLQGFR